MKKQWMMVMVLVGLLWPCAGGVAEDMDDAIGNFLSKFPDILYPSKIYFMIARSGLDILTVKDIFESSSAGKEFPEIDFEFDRVLNQFHYWILPYIFVSKPYKRLYVKEFYTDHGGKRTMFLKNTAFRLPDKVVPYTDLGKVYTDHNGKKRRITGWVRDEPDCGYYWAHYGHTKPENRFKWWPRYNFGRLFKKYGTEGFTTTIVYRFDDEEEKTLVNEYDVREVENRGFDMTWPF